MTTYSKAARARLAAAYEACQLSEQARLAVPVTARDEDPASVLAEARLLLEAVDRYADAAVAVARLGGATWQNIAESLGLSEPEARQRFGPAETRLHDLLASPSKLGIAGNQGAGRGLRASGQPRLGGELGAGEERGPGGEVGVGDWWRGWLVVEPGEAAADLDDWVLHHLDGEPHPGPAPVSAHLT